LKQLFYFIIPLTVIIILGFIFFIPPNTSNNIVNAQSEENKIIENTLDLLKKASAGVAELSKSMKNASELITNSNETKEKEGDQGKGSETLAEQLKSTQEQLNQLEFSDSNDKLQVSNVDLPPSPSPPFIDFSKILKDEQPLVEVEYQSPYSVVLRGEEETLLLLDGTLASFWHAIDIVKQHGYQLKEITESGIGSKKENSTRFYAILEK
jgi:hypothetical protein